MIDTHVHFWLLERDDYGWLTPKNKTLYRDYLPQDVEQSLKGNSVSGVIAVQAAQTVEETDFLLQLATEFSFIKGVVGWLDATSDHFLQQYERVRKHPYFVGIRLGGSVIDNCDAEQTIKLRRNLSVMADDGLSLDLIFRLNEVPSLLNLLHEVPHLKVVINHLGISSIEEGMYESWNGYMRQLAACPNTMCKISGMITQAGGFKPMILKPYVAALVECFGTKRLMFGSDWPVALQAGNYDQVMGLFREVLPDELNQSSWNDICGNNAMSFYRKGFSPCKD